MDILADLCKINRRVGHFENVGEIRKKLALPIWPIGFYFMAKPSPCLHRVNSAHELTFKLRKSIFKEKCCKFRFWRMFLFWTMFIFWPMFWFWPFSIQADVFYFDQCFLFWLMNLFWLMFLIWPFFNFGWCFDSDWCFYFDQYFYSDRYFYLLCELYLFEF